MTVRFNPEAKAEFLESVAYYEGQSPGLGNTFRTAVDEAITQIATLPFLWAILSGRVRRCLVRRFPYGILYNVQTDCVYIVAVMNLHRHPDYWKHRRKEET